VAYPLCFYCRRTVGRSQVVSVVHVTSRQPFVVHDFLLSKILGRFCHTSEVSDGKDILAVTYFMGRAPLGVMDSASFENMDIS
jgi:hypothetical protein